MMKSASPAIEDRVPRGRKGRRQRFAFRIGTFWLCSLSGKQDDNHALPIYWPPI